MPFSNEQYFFLKAIEDHLHFRNTMITNGIDISTLSDISKLQQMESLIYYQTHLSYFQPSFAFASYHEINRKNVLNKVRIILQQENVEYILFKGASIAKYYPLSCLRSMGDTDILIHEYDKNKVHLALVEAGFRCSVQEDKEWCYWYKDFEFELHHSLVYEQTVTEKKQQEWANGVWDHCNVIEGKQYEIELEFHLVYLLIHLRKHLLNNGVGFRQFMDLAVVAKQDINWQIVSLYLQEIGLMEFAQNCFGFVKKWFDIDSPLAGKLSEGFFNKVTEKIFCGGVFGFYDDSNGINDVVNEIRSGNRLKITLSGLFPNYNTISCVKEYSFVNEKPWLLPTAWLYRFFRAIKDKRCKDGINIAFKPLNFTKTMDRENYIKEWGL